MPDPCESPTRNLHRPFFQCRTSSPAQDRCRQSRDRCWQFAPSLFSSGLGVLGLHRLSWVFRSLLRFSVFRVSGFLREDASLASLGCKELYGRKNLYIVNIQRIDSLHPKHMHSRRLHSRPSAHTVTQQAKQMLKRLNGTAQ